MKILVTIERAREKSVVWEFAIRRKEMAATFRMGLILKEPTRTFRVSLGRLLPVECPIPPPEQDTVLTRIIVGHPKTGPTGKQQLAIVGHLQDDISITNNFCWKDGRAIFDTNTQHMRRIIMKRDAM